MGQQLRRYDRSGVEAHRAAGEEVAPANGDEIGCAWARPSDERPRAFPRHITGLARAQVTEPMAMRATKSCAVGPAAASAAASASEGTPRSASTRSDLVRVPEAALSRSRCGTGRRALPAPTPPRLSRVPALRHRCCNGGEGVGGTPQWASAARMAACTSVVAAPLRQPTPATITASPTPIASRAWRDANRFCSRAARHTQRQSG